MAYLTVREPGRVAVTHELGEEASFGREPGNTIVAGSTLVSRRHLRMARVEGGWQLTDLGSSRGTFVNGERAVAPLLLEDRDQIQAGNVILVFRAQVTLHPEVHFHATTVGDTPRGGDAEARRLRLFYDVAAAIAALGDADALIASLLDGVLEVLSCERGLLCLTGKHGGLARRVTRGSDDLVVSGRVIEGLLERRQSAIIDSGHGGEPAAIAAPLLSGGRAIGFLYVAGDARRGGFTSMELEFLSALAYLTASALEQAARQQQLSDVAEVLREERPVSQILGESEAIARLRARLMKIAPSDSTVLVRGESGTGKELVARTLHILSPRAERPFVAVNCAAIPDSLIESELFGHDKGAFTGAVKRRRGKLALADGGTLFLDEVADLSLSAQAKVLRAIENGEIHPVGADEVVEIDVRLVSATHKDLEAEIRAGRFRSDLFYRLNVIELTVPPLRERGDDVVLLAESFLARAAANLGRTGVRFDPEALPVLRGYGWPGNVRQLANEVERALLFADDAEVDLEDLRQRIHGPGRAAPLSLSAAEQVAITRAIEACGGNLVAAARALGVARGTLYRKLKLYGIKVED